MDVELEVVGRRISELRKSEGWRLADLANATGYTVSYLSQIERGVSVPSLTALATVSLALGVEMTVLLDDFVEPTVTITRADEGNELKLNDGQWFRIIGRLGSERPYTAITQDLPRSATSFRHFGERFILVLEGAMHLNFGEEKHQIERMGTIHYGAHEEHTAMASSDDDVEVLIISSPALF